MAAHLLLAAADALRPMSSAQLMAAVAAGGYLFALHKPERQPLVHRSSDPCLSSLASDTAPLMEGRTHAGAVELSVSDRSSREIE